MKDGKAEVLDVKLEPGMVLRVKCAGSEDRDLYIATMRAVSAPGTIFEKIGEAEVVCRPPQRKA